MIAPPYEPLHGQSVLVKSSRDRHNPPIAVRGTLEVSPAAPGQSTPTVKVVIDVPEMFTVTAHRRTLVLSEAELARLVASERGGFELVTDQALT